MLINWLEPTEGPGGIPLPTYGNYGGPNWSGGEFVGGNEPGNYTVAPLDDLDRLFFFHDMVYDQPNTLVRALSDLTLIEGIRNLPEDAVTGEGDLFGGAAILAMLYQVAIVNDHPELLLTLDLRDVAQDAIGLIEQGSIAPDPAEVAGFVSWLEEISTALAALDNPVADYIAGEILEHAGSLGPNGEPVFPIVLADVSFDFDSKEALALLAPEPAAVGDVVDIDDLGGFVRDVLADNPPADLVADATPGCGQPPLAALASKVDDFLSLML